MSAAPQYTTHAISASVAFSTANTNRDGSTGTYATAYTFLSAANKGLGGRIDYLTVEATSTTTAGMIRLFVNSALVREIAVSAITPSATVKAWTIPASEGADINGRLALGIVLAPGDVIKLNTHNAESFVARIEGGEF
jgi:hypothetical protein